MSTAGELNAACTHPRAQHRHGTYPCAKRDKCSCGPCRVALRERNRAVTRRDAYGRSPWVDADESSHQLDEVLVERLMAGTAHVASAAPELVEAVRRLAAQGLPDRLIGERVGRTDDGVARLRKVHGIDLTVAAQYRPLGFSSVSSHRHKYNRTSRSTSSAVRATRSEDVTPHLLEDARTA